MGSCASPSLYDNRDHQDFDHRSEEKPRQKRRGASSTSSSTTDPEGPEPARGRQRERTLAARKKRRLKKYLDRAFDANARGTALLADQAVTAQVQRCYEKEVDELLRFVSQQNLAFKEDQDIDAGIVKFMNRCFWLGEQAHKGEKLLAAFMRKKPDFGRLGSRKLPRSWRALKGWRRLTPARSRSGGRGRLHHGRVELARSPFGGAACAAEWTLLLSPEHLEQPGKTGEYDLSAALDSSYLRPWSHTVFGLLKKQPDNAPLWDFNYGDYVAEFRKACQTLRLDLSPYQMRHSGPSIDRANNWRSALEIQKRGGWKSAKSVMRYEKSARLGAAFLSSCPFVSGSTASGAKIISGMLSSSERLLWRRLEEAPLQLLFGPLFGQGRGKSWPPKAGFEMLRV